MNDDLLNYIKVVLRFNDLKQDDVNIIQNHNRDSITIYVTRKIEVPRTMLFHENMGTIAKKVLEAFKGNL